MTRSNVDPSDLEIVTFDELHEHSTEELIALIRKRRSMDHARAREALATMRFAVRQGDSSGLRLVEFEGKYELLMPAELRELSDDELVKLIMERARMDESRAREALSNIRGGPPYGMTYERV